MTDEQIIVQLVRVKRLHPTADVCALEALAREAGAGKYDCLVECAFAELGVSVAIAWGLMSGWDGFDWKNRETPSTRLSQLDAGQFNRGVAIGRAVREACP